MFGLCRRLRALAFDGLLALALALPDAYLDLLGLRFGLLGEPDLEDAVGVAGVDLLAVHRVRKREGAGEGAVAALDAVEVLFLLLLLELALAADSEGVV